MREIVYRDDEGLRSLLGQIQDLQSTNITIHHEGNREWTLGSKIKLGFGKILGKLGLPEAEMNGDTAMKRTNKVTRKAEFTESTEAIYRSVLRNLSGQKILYSDAYEAWCAARVSAKGIFCEFERQFVPVGWVPDSDAWRKFANDQGTFILHAVEDKSLLVGMGLSKIFGIRDGIITPTCHLAMRFRGGKALFRIFVSIDAGKYIKPFLVTFG